MLPVMLGLYPNITGSLTADNTTQSVMDSEFTGAGAITPKNLLHIISGPYETGSGFTGFEFSAKKSNEIFGASSTVQPSAIQSLIIIKV